MGDWLVGSMHALMDGWTGSLTDRQQRIIIVPSLPIVEESNLQYTHQSTHSGCTEPRQTSMWPRPASLEPRDRLAKRLQHTPLNITRALVA